MRPTVRTFLATALASCCLLTSCSLDGDSGHSVAAPARPAALLDGEYVALGDSYTSGPDLPSQTGEPAGCARSDHNYPALVAQALKFTGSRFHDQSCSGATIADLSAPQSTKDGTNPAQFSALSTSTELVTLGIGGNDLGFSTLISTCVQAGLLYFAMPEGSNFLGQAPCRNRYLAGASDSAFDDSSDGTELEQKLRTTGTRLAAALLQIRLRAPLAKIYVIGYPAILSPGGSRCGHDMRLAPGDVTFLDDLEQKLNATLRRQAEAADAGFVDTYTPSTGLGACSAPGRRWIEPLIPVEPAAAVHPNARGERGMADAVLTLARGN